MTRIIHHTSLIALIAAISAAPALGIAQTATETAVAEAPAEMPARPVEGHIIMQSENTVLANDLIGSNVYSATGEAIGEIDDMIVHLDGSVEGIVIGVGGFLGIGEKDVAVALSSLSTSSDGSGNTRLVTTASREDLEAAEAFITAEQQQTALEMKETMDKAQAPAHPTAAPADPSATQTQSN